MSSINHHTREINVKIVYYGPGLGGKTSSLQCLHRNLPDQQRGQLVSLATTVDRTLYFDFLPVKLPKVRDFHIRISLYTVPGQVHYNATRKLVLQGCDGMVFVADSQKARGEANIESMQNLEENLRAHGMNPLNVPLVIEYNKRDLVDICPVAEMAKDLNPRQVPAFETCALTGKGIAEALKAIIKLVLADLKRKGIYKDQELPKAPAAAPAMLLEKQPTVSAKVETSLVSAIQEHVQHNSTPGRRLSLSELWPSEQARDEILALEGDIEREDYDMAVCRAQGALFEYLGKVEGSEGVVEEFLLLGVHGAHYERFRRAVTSEAPTRADAMFSLFFLIDIGLRRQARITPR